MKLTVLVDDITFSNNINSEHGLSFYIEANGKKILFDMGQSDLFAINAEKLGIDLSLVDFAVVSHGHYDHGGGLQKFLEINKNAPVFISKNAFGDFYNGTEKYIGLDKSLKNNQRLVFVEDYLAIDNGFEVYSCNNRENKFEINSYGLNKFINGEFIPDDFLHEQYLLIKEQGKNILISGCSHRGILNIVDWFGADILVGGFHFVKAALDEKLENHAKYLGKYKTKYYTCHCTGFAQYEFMGKYLPDLKYISCGTKLSIDK